MTIIVALLLFGVLVFIHELGHFLFAKKSGVKIHEFAIGMGPKIYSIKKDTLYSIRLLPLGGFVSMEGEDGESSDPRAFGKKSLLQRASIIFAGPLFNIVLAALILIPVFLYIGSPTTTVNRVLDNSPAQSAGLIAGDTIKSIGDDTITSWDQVRESLDKSNGNDIKIIVDRDGQIKEFNVIPKLQEGGAYAIGVESAMEKDLLNSITTAFKTTWGMTAQMVTFLGQLVTGTVPGGVANSVSGPLGVISIVSDAAKTGVINIAYIASVISLNLGIMNLLPLPALDGGRLLLLILEGIRGGKKIDPNKEAMINAVGLGALMLFMIFITYKDILRIF